MGRTSLEHIPLGEEAKFNRDWAGEMKKYNDAKEAAAKK